MQIWLNQLYCTTKQHYLSFLQNNIKTLHKLNYFAHKCQLSGICSLPLNIYLKLLNWKQSKYFLIHNLKPYIAFPPYNLVNRI